MSELYFEFEYHMDGRNFLNYIEHSFSAAIANWFHSLDEEGKNIVRIIETPTTMFKNYIRKSKLNLSEVNLILNKMLESGQEILITYSLGYEIYENLYC